MRWGISASDIFFVFLLILPVSSKGADWNPFAVFGRSDELKSELVKLEGDLSTLPYAALAKRPWTLGFQSSGHLKPQATIVIEVELRELWFLR